MLQNMAKRIKYIIGRSKALLGLLLLYTRSSTGILTHYGVCRTKISTPVDFLQEIFMGYAIKTGVTQHCQDDHFDVFTDLQQKHCL